MNYADGRGGILGLRDFRQVAPCQWSRRVAFPGSICEIEIPISSAASSVHLLRVDQSDPLILCLWANCFAILIYARVFSRCNDFVPLHSEGIYRALRCHAFLQSSTCPEHQFSLNLRSVFLSRELYMACGTYWVLLQFIWGGQAQRIYAQDSGSALRLNSYRMTSTFRLGIGASSPWWTCHPLNAFMVHHVKCILGL